MRGRGTRSIATPAAALLVVMALGACGGSDSGTGASTSAGPGDSGSKADAGSGSGAAGKGKGGKQANGAEGSGGGDSGGSGSSGGGDSGSGSSGSKVKTAPLVVSGGGSAQYRVRGGDNSVQEFGEESDPSELEEAATVLHDYLVARAKEEWPRACTKLASSVKDQLRTLASRSENLKGQGCAAILEALTPELPASVKRESTIVDAGSLRVEGEQAFLIFRGQEGKTYTILMAAEDGWKVGSLGATALS